MTLADRLAFNVVFNALVSLIGGMLVVSLVLVFLRRKARANIDVWFNALRLYLFSLPFLKLVLDLTRGLPSDSVVWIAQGPLSHPQDLHGQLSGSLGFSFWGAFLEVVLRVRHGGQLAFSASAADWLGALIAAQIGPLALRLALVAVASISVALAARRLIGATLFSIERRRLRDCPGSESLESRRLFLRQVDLYVSPYHCGSPFTGGVFRPYVCMPKDTYDALTVDEREAALAHEIAHVLHWDAVQGFALELIADVFWFVPGLRWLKAKVEREREFLADATAIARGVQPAWLAAALLRLATVRSKPLALNGLATGGHAFLRHKSQLKQRIEALVACNLSERLNPCLRSRFRLGWRVATSLALAVWVSGSVFATSLAGNRNVQTDVASEVKAAKRALTLLPEVGARLKGLVATPNLLSPYAGV